MDELFGLLEKLTEEHGATVKLFTEFDYAIWPGHRVLAVTATWKDGDREMVQQWSFTEGGAKTATIEEMMSA